MLPCLQIWEFGFSSQNVAFDWVLVSVVGVPFGGVVVVVCVTVPSGLTVVCLVCDVVPDPDVLVDGLSFTVMTGAPAVPEETQVVTPFVVM